MTTAHKNIIRDWRHGDDTRAARWLTKNRGLRVTHAHCRYFRLNERAYSPELRDLFTTAYRRIQLNRKYEAEKNNSTTAARTSGRNAATAYIYRGSQRKRDFQQ